MRKRKIWAPLILTALFLLSGCRSDEYAAALESYEAGDYEAAVSAFAALGDYKDSAALIQSCEEQLAAARDAELRSRVTGRWVCGEIDVTEAFELALAAGEGERFAALCELPELYVALEMSLAEDGRFTQVFNEEDCLRAEETVIAALQEGILEYLLETVREVYAEAGELPEDSYERLGAANEKEFLEATMGMSMEELYKTMGLSTLVAESWEPDASEGNWSLEDGVLTLNSMEAEYDAAADTISLDGRVYTRE